MSTQWSSSLSLVCLCLLSSAEERWQERFTDSSKNCAHHMKICCLVLRFSWRLFLYCCSFEPSFLKKEDPWLSLCYAGLLFSVSTQTLKGQSFLTCLSPSPPCALYSALWHHSSRITVKNTKWLLGKHINIFSFNICEKNMDLKHRKTTLQNISYRFLYIVLYCLYRVKGLRGNVWW